MSEIRRDTPEAVERLADAMKWVYFDPDPHQINNRITRDEVEAALRAYAQLLRQVAQAIHALDAINVERLDREEAHGDADVIALAAIPGIQAAWERVRERAGGFWYA